MTNEVSYVAALLVGLLGGVHCVGMCGGIVGALSFSATAQQRTPWMILLAYNLGRITSYTLAGVLAGFLGAALLSTIPLADLQKMLLVLAGVFMLLMGLYLSNWWPLLRHVERLGGQLWKRIEPLGRKLLPVRSPAQALLLGMIWGWLPCGLVYSVLIWSMSSGGPVSGAILMLSFGLGTLPNLLLMGIVASRLQTLTRQLWLKRLVGSLLIGFAVLMWWRAWQLSLAL